MPTRTTLITGASRGIGLATARLLASQGHHVVGVARHMPATEFPGEFHLLDVTDVQAVEKMLKQLPMPVDCLVNNAGSAVIQPLGAVTPEAIDRIFEINIKSAVMLTQLCVAGMRARKWGRIVNLSSRAALGKEGRSIYAASKAGLTGLTRTWALELAGDGITVNAVAPGPIATEMFHIHNPPDSPKTRKIIDEIPLRRIGRPEEVAAAIGFFLGDEAGFVTGQTLYVCGGLTVGRAP